MSMKESNQLMKELSDKLKAIYDVAKQHEDGFCVICNTEIGLQSDSCKCGESYSTGYEDSTSDLAIFKIKQLLGIRND